MELLLLDSRMSDRRLALAGGEGPLFWNTEGEEYPPALKHANPQLRELTGLKDIRPHDFRRTGAATG